ncbi:hypothetical protein I7412_16095, partial [Frankia sp. CN6]|nr:hypothetical protein [Frankia nepalensis]
MAGGEAVMVKPLATPSVGAAAGRSPAVAVAVAVPLYRAGAPGTPRP